MIWFIAGFIVGGLVGFLVTALVVAIHDEDDYRNSRDN